jgi:hypothetical protein
MFAATTLQWKTLLLLSHLNSEEAEMKDCNLLAVMKDKKVLGLLDYER